MTKASHNLPDYKASAPKTIFSGLFWRPRPFGYGDREGFPVAPKKKLLLISGPHPVAEALSPLTQVSPDPSLYVHWSRYRAEAVISGEQLTDVNPLVSPISEEEIASILARDKYWVEDLQWAPRPPNSAILVAGSSLRDETGATIAGLTVECRYRKGTVANRCKYQFTIFLLRGNRERIYQIEVIPADQMGHRENGVPWYGPHQHFGHAARQMPKDVTIGCDDHEACFRAFLRLANIHFSGKYWHPEFGTQMGLDW